MDSLVTIAQVAKLNVALASSALEVLGWTTTKLASVRGEDADVLDVLLLQIEGRFPDRKFGGLELDELVEAADAAAETLWASGTGYDDSELAMESRLSRVRERLSTIRAERIRDISRQVPRKGQAVRNT